MAGVHLVFLLDASSPESVAKVIEDAGHKPIRHNDVLAEGATDVVVCETAMKADGTGFITGCARV